ncbi:putative methyltransferase (contains TPR repeat) [Hoeflea sp. IMCC20628]|uniref:methyltransferase n=1 Tax=Hoeflea sp. IMCC20628 TaxID=1620421 RepID=UPI00063BEF4F|nr:methyltransferase [Hoeflea sp. IMCC20628]AKI02307.1 putative methyltransferase (contains TPR repeat) [Hoeflea sp. IMCC20628]
MTSHQLSSGDLTADRRAHYAHLYAEADDLGAAVDLQVQALELAPNWAAGWHGLGGYREKAGDLAGAAVAWRKVLTLAPVDIFGAGLKLSLTGQAAAPSIPPAEYVEALFDGYSDRFDTALLEDLGYCVPERLTMLLGDVAGAETQFAKVIDLGCGTGLFGERIRSRTSWLEGYDLSQGMLSKAFDKGVYDRLGQADILHGIAAARLKNAKPADLVAAADVFAYFGDLDGVLGIASGLTTPGGLMAFSCEAGVDGVDWLLQSSLRYCHSESYLRLLAERHGLSIERLDREAIRRDGANVITGLLVIARKQSDAGLRSVVPPALAKTSTAGAEKH